MESEHTYYCLDDHGPVQPRLDKRHEEPLVDGVNLEVQLVDGHWVPARYEAPDEVHQCASFWVQVAGTSHEAWMRVPHGAVVRWPEKSEAA